MNLTALRPILWTEDLIGTLDFYTGILGFTCDEVNMDWGWASLSSGQASLMLAKPNSHTPFDKIGFTGSFYFNTDDVEDAWENLQDKARICYGIETFDWGMREFAIFDNNGYMLQFGQEIQ